MRAEKIKPAEETKPKALEVIEAAREAEWKYPSFLGELFMGRFRSELIFPYPEQEEEDRRIGNEYMAKVETFLKEKLDPDAVDRTGEIPPKVIQGLVDLGCFAIKIPKEYGGLGLSQLNYNRVVSLIASYCGSTAVWLSAHQSIGVPQPLKLFGTEEQKRRFMPRLAQGSISAFALTELDVGSDPANMKTTATPIEEGRYYLLNGEKLWCTNGPVADILIVMAKTPLEGINSKKKEAITAFIVERNMPGFEIGHQCDFMGLKGIKNGLLRFKAVRVPKENILWGPGLGLKLALITLNTGRLTIPAACVGMAKQCLVISRKWASERHQWGGPIGKHEAIAHKLAFIASHTFAMESMTWLASTLADKGKTDIRLEAAMAKLFCTEIAWKIVDETMQIRGGRGYETADSLRSRGEKAYPVERMMRDARINRIIEGSSEIMRLFISREALDPHMRVAGELLNPKLAWWNKIKAMLRAGWFYSKWYPLQWFFWSSWPKHRALEKRMASSFRFVDKTAHRLARAIFRAMLFYQEGLQKKQMILGRLVDMGADLFAMAASCSKAHALFQKDSSDPTSLELADYFCSIAQRRIKDNFRILFKNEDKMAYGLALKVLKEKMSWLEEGIVKDLE